MVRKIEEAMGIMGGKQDQYAAALGGINFLEFNNNNVKVERLKLKRQTIEELEKSLVLYYTGEHYSSDINKNIVEDFRKGKNVESLLRIKEIAREMRNALLKNDIYKIPELMNFEFEERKKLHKKVANKKIEDAIRIAFKNGASGAKICGAGGGGSLLFYCSDKKKLLKKLKCWEFKFDFEGLKVIRAC